MKSYIVALLFVLSSTAAFAWPGTVTQVHDGDTITVEREDTKEKVRVRLYGVDAPEKKQPFGKEATGGAGVVFGKRVSITEIASDRYGRSVAIVVDLDTGTSLQETMLESGLAWVYPQYCKGCTTWRAMEKEARAKRVGLWQDERPVQPWEWRKSKKK